MVFIALGSSMAATGLGMKIVAKKWVGSCDKFKMAVIGTLLVEVAGYVSLLCFFLESYGLCFAVAVLWGCSESFLQTNINALIGELFPGKVEANSLYRSMFAMGVVFTILLNIVLRDLPAWVFLTVIMAVQVLMTRVSLNLNALKEINSSPGEESLLSEIQTGND